MTEEKPYRHVDEIERLRSALEKASQSFWAIRKLCSVGGPISDEAVRALREIEHMPRGQSAEKEEMKDFSAIDHRELIERMIDAYEDGQGSKFNRMAEVLRIVLVTSGLPADTGSNPLNLQAYHRP